MFYLYTYLDPRKPGHYNYDNFSFLFEPIYIGKGKGNRFLAHLKEALVWNHIPYNIKHYKIRKIVRETKQLPFILILSTDKSEKVILDYEEVLINKIGTIINGTGPLCNVRLTTWKAHSKEKTNKTETRKTNGLYGHRAKTMIDLKTSEMLQVPESKIPIFKNIGFHLVSEWNRPLSNNSMSRKGNQNPMYGKSAIKGRKWITLLNDNKSYLLTEDEIKNINEPYRFGRIVQKNKRRRVIVKGQEKSSYMTEFEIQSLPSGTQYQYGLLWKNNKEVKIANGI